MRIYPAAICTHTNTQAHAHTGTRMKINKYIYEMNTISFQTFFVMGTFIDSTHMKL